MMDDSGIDSDVKVSSALDICGGGAASFPVTDSSATNTPSGSPKSTLWSNTSSIFQQKLGRKIAQSKSQTIDKVTLSNNLIPIQRLPFPSSTITTVCGKRPLVSWASSDSEDEITFFSLGPASQDTRHFLTDTFSINELQLSESDDDLGLLPPTPTPVVMKADNCCFRLGKCCIL